MAKPTSNLRLFVALYPPLESARALIESLDSLSLPHHRRTEVGQLHMTVQFIGDTPARELDAVIESVQRGSAGLDAFELMPERLITLPERGPARLVAAQTDSPGTLMEIHRRLVTRLARNVRERDAERFRPHLTLCRFRSPARGVRIDAPLMSPVFAVNQIKLMRSTLGSSGAQHHEVISFELARM